MDKIIRRRHTPVELMVLLHHYCNPSEYEDRAPSVGAAIKYWIAQKCLEAVPPQECAALMTPRTPYTEGVPRPSPWRITPKGEAMVAVWLNQAVPEQRSVFVDEHGAVVPVGDQRE